MKRSSGKRVIVILVIVDLLLGLLACGIFSWQPSPTTFFYYWYYHGASKQDVLEVAEAFGVEWDDVAQYGDTTFPLNYVRHAAGMDGDRSGDWMTRDAIHQLMRGYVSYCHLSRGQELYVYYSGWLTRGPEHRGQAYVISVEYVYWDSEPSKDRVTAIRGWSTGWDVLGVARRTASHCRPRVEVGRCLYYLPLIGCID
jgi:hypothetical protein